MVVKDKTVVTSEMGVRVGSGRAGNQDGGYTYAQNCPLMICALYCLWIISLLKNECVYLCVYPSSGKQNWDQILLMS